MTDVARKQNATNVALTHKRRRTFSSQKGIDEICNLDIEESTTGNENLDEKRKKIQNKFIVKSFLKNCYSMLTTGVKEEEKKETKVTSPSRRMTVQPNFKQFEQLKFMMKETPTAIEEEKDDETVIVKNVTPADSYRNSQQVSKVDISITTGLEQFKTFDDTKKDLSSKSSDRIKHHPTKRVAHQRTSTNNGIYDKIVKQKDGSGMKKTRKLNQILSRLTKHTESSERRNRNSQIDSAVSKPVHPYENSQSQTAYTAMNHRRVVNKKKSSVSKSAEKSKSPIRNITELNNAVKLTRRVREVNKQKGILLARISKGQLKAESNVEFVINEQASIIEEYHKSLKEAIDKNEKLEKKLELLKKELGHKALNKSTTSTINFLNKKEINPKITVTDCLKNNIVTISYKTPGKHKKNSKSFINYLDSK